VNGLDGENLLGLLADRSVCYQGFVVQNQTKVNWDDLRVALAVARAGSVRGASRALRVSHSTVLRRLQELEAAVGARLFERTLERYELTNAGQDLFDTASDIEDGVLSLERRVEGRDLKLSGPLRVTLPDPLLPALLPVFHRFMDEYTEIDLTLSVAVEYLDLAQREADVALRIASAPPPELVGRRVASVACAIYGSERYLHGRATRNLGRLAWVGWPSGSAMGFARWMQEHVPKARVALRVDNSWALRDAVDAHVGVALLPCVLGDARPGWRRVRLVPEVSVPLWILTHRDLRATARVRALRDTLWAAISADRALYEGTARAKDAKNTKD
jgi:DNA-binding transcriptional LysR family regulator